MCRHVHQLITIRRTVTHPRLKLSIHLIILLVLPVENSSPRCRQTVMMRLLRLHVTPVLLRLRHNTRLRFKGVSRLCWNSYRFITIYKSTYEFSLPRISCQYWNKSRSYSLEYTWLFAAERWINRVEISSTPNVVPLPVSTCTQTGSIRDASAVEIKSQRTWQTLLSLRVSYWSATFLLHTKNINPTSSYLPHIINLTRLIMGLTQSLTKGRSGLNTRSLTCLTCKHLYI